MSTVMTETTGTTGATGTPEKAPAVRPGNTPVPSESGLNVVRHALIVARRNLRKIPGNPSLLLDATVMPMVFALMFIYVFGGAIAGDSADYRQFVMPGIMGITITIVSRTTGTALAVDFGRGVVDRFRTLPIARSAVLSGQVLADTVRMVLGMVVILVFALAIGFRIHTDIVSALGAVALLTLFGVALSWVSAFIGLTVRSIQGVETMTTLAMVPLQFGSSIFVEPSTMPGWLQGFVEWNPMTLVVDASRGMLLGGPVAEPGIKALVWIALLLVVFVPLSVWAYSRRRN